MLGYIGEVDVASLDLNPDEVCVVSDFCLLLVTSVCVVSDFCLCC